MPTTVWLYLELALARPLISAIEIAAMAPRLSKRPAADVATPAPEPALSSAAQRQKPTLSRFFADLHQQPDSSSAAAPAVSTTRKNAQDYVSDDDLPCGRLRSSVRMITQAEDSQQEQQEQQEQKEQQQEQHEPLQPLSVFSVGPFGSCCGSFRFLL